MSASPIRRARVIRPSSSQAPISSPASKNGNYFEFWQPKQTGQLKPQLPKLVSKNKPTTSSTAAIQPAKASTAPAAVSAHKFLSAHFQRTQTSPLKSKGTFGSSGNGYQVISKLNFIRAALELGYGPRKTWNSVFALSDNSGKELAYHLLLRLESIMSCLSQGVGGVWEVRKFYEKIEASEKVTISFVLGSIFSFHAAKMWLRASGDDLDLFLHAGLYTKAIVHPSVRVNLIKNTNQCPDFLVYSKSQDWSLFESKGGTSANKWGRLYKGLQQLQGSRTLGWAHTHTTTAPEAYVCVYTEVDTGRPLKTIAIDPPEDEFPSFPGDDEAIPELPELVLVKGVVQLMVILQAIDQFHAMVPDAKNQNITSGKWCVIETRKFGGMVVGIPRKLLDFEPRIRAILACFFAVQEILEIQNLEIIIKSNDLNNTLSRLILDYLEKVDDSSAGKRQVKGLAKRLDNIPDGVKRIILADNTILQECAKFLRIDQLAYVMMKHIQEMRISGEYPVDGDVKIDITTGGLFLSEASN